MMDETGLNECLGAVEIVLKWGTVPGEPKDLYTREHENNERTAKIEKAIVNEELKARVEVRAPGYGDGYKTLTDINDIRKIIDGCFQVNHKKMFVQFFIYRNDFREWLIKSNQWPLADDCLLARWWPQLEQQTEVIGDDGLGTVWDDLPAVLSELNQRNEAPYDGVLGCPPDSITENEKERFISIRNRLLDGESYTEADIHGLIDDCNTNSNSFSRIPDRLKQDIRFLASLWRAIKKNEPQTEAVGDAGAGIDAQEDSKAYELYKKSLDALNIDLKSLKVEDIFKQVKLTDKKLWSIAYATFKRDVWPIYSKENNLGKQPGRPRNK